MTSQENLAFDQRAHRGDGCAQTVLIPVGNAARRRPVRSRLAKRKIATQHGQTCRTKGIGERGQKECLAVRSRTVRQNNAIPHWTCRPVQKAPDRRLRIRLVNEFFNARHHDRNP
jgi:hypothetical protein